MRETAEHRYHARMRRVLDHIDRHLDGDLGVEALAGVAAFSPFHFHRQFAALFGIPVGRYVQLARLKRASYALAYRGEPVTGVALDAGYEGPEAFARAFRQRIGQSPSDFRDAPDWKPWHHATAPLGAARSLLMPEFTDKDVRLETFPETRVALLAHHGDPAMIGDTIRSFIAWRKATGTTPPKSATFNILHVDPDTVAPEDYRLDLCAATDAPIAQNDAGVVPATLPGGRVAILRLKGSSDDLRAATAWLYGDWLPRSGEEPRDAPFFAQRVSFFPEVPANEAVTDIFLPLR